MERGAESVEEREKSQANDSSSQQVTLAVLRKDIYCLLDFIERLKNQHNINVDIQGLEELKLAFTLTWTFVQLSYFNLDGADAMSELPEALQDLIDEIFCRVGDDILIKCDMDHVVPRLLKSISIISTQDHLKSSATLTKEQLVDLLDTLLVNFHEIPNILKLRNEEEFSWIKTPMLMKQYDVLQNVCSNVKSFLGLKVNGWVVPEIIEYVLPQVQLMVERVGHLVSSIFTEGFEDFELSHLLVKIIPVALEVMRICSTHLKASNRQKLDAS